MLPSQAADVRDIAVRVRDALSHRYTIERELGRGGMVPVYFAHDLRHDCPVVLKVLHPGPAATLGADRFHREIRTAARLQHRHVLGLRASALALALTTASPLMWTACSSSTESIPVKVMHIEGRVLDMDSGHGIQGVEVSLTWSAGAFGHGGCCSVESDTLGHYDLMANLEEQFGQPAQCSPGTFDLGVVVPQGYQVVPGGHPLECTETTQLRDVGLRHTSN